MKPFMVNFQLMDHKAISDLRENLIQFREHALNCDRVDWALTLSYCIAVFSHLMDLMNQEPGR